MSNYPQFAHTGPHPEKGYVGFVNIQETDKGVKFTVRSEGENPVLAEFEIDIGEAIDLLAKALTNFCERGPCPMESWHERLKRLVSEKDYAGALALLRHPAPSSSPGEGL